MQPTRSDWLRLGLVLLMVAVALEPALAQLGQKSPFGVGGAIPRAEPTNGIAAWLMARQAEFTRAMIAGVRGAAQSSAGLLSLCGIALAYGVFHAAGPGHGKAVIASYVVADSRILRRAVGISFLAAFIQAVIAIALVYAAVLAFGATARQIDASVNWIEIVSFAAIVGLGLMLFYRKSLALRRLLGKPRGEANTEPEIALPESARLNAPECAVCGAGLSYAPNGVTPGPACNHVHLPSAGEVAKAGSFRDLLMVAFAAGSRPCSGALILLAFALSQSAPFAGIAAVLAMALGTALTTSGFAIAAVLARKGVERIAAGTDRLQIALAVLEWLASIAIVLIGGALFLGYLSGG